MRQNVVIGLDWSTQSTKAIVLELKSGWELAASKAPHSGASMHSPDDW